MPEDFKLALLLPILKKCGLDQIFPNYRPVFNLHFVSKVLEKASCLQLVDHIKLNGLYEKFQSAYTEGRSCETALLRIQNDIRMAMDRQEVTFLVLLDMSAAFDTVSHDILLERLSVYTGIKGKALEWIASYLQNRRQAVTINGELSDELLVKCGVPQGSVSGPLYFLLYTLPLGRILSKYSIKYHFYADDNQDYMSFKVEDLDTNVANLVSCLKELRTWLITNRLMNNTGKQSSLCMVHLNSFQNLEIYV